MKTLLLCVGLLLTWGDGQVLGEPLVSNQELQEMSTQGSKYINKEIQNAVKGVKEIKTLIEKTNEERKSLLDTLEEAKKKKEDALDETRDSEMKLKAIPGVCNETMMALWEECKPCLKQTCMKFYARVCRSGSGLVGHQLEEFLNQSSPFYFWMNGDRIDSLLESDRSQSPNMDFIREGDDDQKAVCKEIRHNSTGCLKMKDRCDKCQEILSVDCSTNNPAQAQLRQELNDSLQIAERLTQRYNELLRSYQRKMFNTSSLLEQLNDQFSWLSQLANLTQSEDQAYLRVSTVTSHISDSEAPSRVTEVVVKLFDSDPITVVIPEVPKDSPKFMDTVAEKALQEYRKKSREE
uniref:Clusterin n=1 Tax=Marmota marmota marmota TaxID=9994 RepID=A0A8C5ZLD6_MARMA